MKTFDLTKPESYPVVGQLCSDMDEDCAGIACHLTCWLHAPELGVCPYLSAGEPQQCRQ